MAGIEEHIYDEYFVELDTAKARRFLSWLGLMQPTASDVQTMQRLREDAKEKAKVARQLAEAHAKAEAELQTKVQAEAAAAA